VNREARRIRSDRECGIGKETRKSSIDTPANQQPKEHYQQARRDKLRDVH
jgi:hypothetical protein